MEGFVAEDKYQKLASEYAKLRAQASVLKKALLEEQGKSSALRDQFKQKETTLRRAEQEIDSLGFRNKQLEHRVASLQEELIKSESRKKEKDGKKVINIGDTAETQQVNLSDLQTKIIENGVLTSMLDEKTRCVLEQEEHIKSLENSLHKQSLEHTEAEKRLRREMETLQCRNQELETKLVEAASMLGSEDGLSASGSENIAFNNQHQQSASLDSRINNLEQEVAHWRAKYELSKLYTDTLSVDTDVTSKSNLACCNSTTTAAGLTIIPSFADGKSKRDSGKEQVLPCSKELLLFNNLSKKFEDLLKEKMWATSKVGSIETEVDHLQNCLENATQELKNKDDQLESINQALHLLEEDLTTTRLNYDDQISVLTEQIISLSEQLAASN